MFALTISAIAFVNSVETITTSENSFVAVKARATSGADDKKQSHTLSFSLPMERADELAKGDLIEVTGGNAWPKAFIDKEGVAQVDIRLSKPEFTVRKKVEQPM